VDATPIALSVNVMPAKYGKSTRPSLETVPTLMLCNTPPRNFDLVYFS
jgi:hypothetical protein